MLTNVANFILPVEVAKCRSRALHLSEANVAIETLNRRPGSASHARNTSRFSEKMRDVSSPALKQRLALSVAQCENERSAAESLLNKRYEWRGYGSSHKIVEAENRTTFLVHLGPALAGTITLGVDTPNGLAVDKLYKNEIDKFRNAPGAQICELTKFAFEKGSKGDSNNLLACLFHAVFLYGIDSFNCTDLFIEVNPRHRRFYQAMLNFTPIGDLRMNDTVEAPSQLMWINVSQIAEQIKAYRSGKATSNHSLYALFLSEAEEMVVKSRLALRREHATLNTLFERR